MENRIVYKIDVVDDRIVEAMAKKAREAMEHLEDAKRIIKEINDTDIEITLE